MVAQTGLSYATLNAFAILFSEEQRASNSSSYAFYEEYFPGLTSTKETWKQSVRHNFCTTKYFTKISDGLYQLTKDPNFIAKFKKSVEKRCTPGNLEITRKDMKDPQMLEMMIERFMKWADGECNFSSTSAILTPPSEDDLSIRCRKRKEEPKGQGSRKIHRQHSAESAMMPQQSIYATPKASRVHQSPQNVAFPPTPPGYIDPSYRIINNSMPQMQPVFFHHMENAVSPYQANQVYNGYSTPLISPPTQEYMGGLEPYYNPEPVDHNPEPVIHNPDPTFYNQLPFRAEDMSLDKLSS